MRAYPGAWLLSGCALCRVEVDVDVVEVEEEVGGRTLTALDSFLRRELQHNTLITSTSPTPFSSANSSGFFWEEEGGDGGGGFFFLFIYLF